MFFFIFIIKLSVLLSLLRHYLIFVKSEVEAAILRKVHMGLLSETIRGFRYIYGGRETFG